MAVTLSLERLSSVNDQLFLEDLRRLLKLMALLLSLVSALAKVLAILLQHFDTLLQNFVVLRSRGAPGVKLVHLIVMEFNLACEVLATAFEGANLILKLVILQFDL
jgi:hypothetical protein